MPDYGLHVLPTVALLLCLTSSSVANDQQSLLAFKPGVRYPTGVLSNWKSGSNSLPVCKWNGVTCDKHLRVMTLSVPSSHLAGSISPAIGGLEFLQYVDLTNNSFSGPLPLEIGNCSNLKSIVITQNLVAGEIPATLGNLRSLQTLRLSNNNLTSEIPTALGNCSELIELDLSHNVLDGFLPASLGNCTKLFLLALTDNFLTGPIPSSFGNLVILQGLLMGSNSLTGGIPIELFNVTQRLTEVALSKNRFSGSLPDKFDGFQTLSVLDLSSNRFTGEIPTTLGLSKALLSLNLAHNEFRGALPSSLGNVRSTFEISLNLTHNLLSGPIDVLWNFSYVNNIYINSIDISANKFTGFIGVFGQGFGGLTTLDISENLFSGGITIVAPLLVYLNVSNNNFTGSIDYLIAGDNLTNFTKASFLPGNEGLCGLVLGRPCPGESPSPDTAPSPDTGNWRTGNKRMTHRSVPFYAGGAALVFGVLLALASCLDGARVRSTRHLRDCVTCYGRGLQIVRLTVKDLWTATDGFNERLVIGRGGTSTVYKGLLPFYQFIIAVKKFQDDEAGRQRLLKEAGIMNIVRHRNVVGTLGIASVPRSINVLVLKHIANGSLNEHLHGNEVCEVSWEVRLNIAIDVATAVSYLHEDSDEHLAIIHGDLKPGNILLESDFTAKVGDFGLAKLLADVDSSQRDTWEGTFGYSPPGDVYSFGVVILEMVTGRRPASLAFEDLGGAFLDWVRAAFPDRLHEIVDPGLKLAEDLSAKKDAMGLFFRVGLLCTRNNPHERPTMRDALEMIKTLQMNPAGAAEAAVPEVPVRSMEELIDQPSSTSFQHAKSWGWVDHNFILDSRDSALQHDSWISLFKLDIRESRTLKAMGFKTVVITNIRKQIEERGKIRDSAARRPSWMRSVWGALFHRKASRRVQAE